MHERKSVRQSRRLTSRPTCHRRRLRPMPARRTRAALLGSASRQRRFSRRAIWPAGKCPRACAGSDPSARRCLCPANRHLHRDGAADDVQDDDCARCRLPAGNAAAKRQRVPNGAGNPNGQCARRQIVVPERRTATQPYTVCRMTYENVSRQFTVDGAADRDASRDANRLQADRRAGNADRLQATSAMDNPKLHRLLRLHADLPGWVPNIVTEQVPVTVYKPQFVEETFPYQVVTCRPEQRTIRSRSPSRCMRRSRAR